MQALEQIVITIHGVESRGEWMDQVHPELTGIDDLKHYPHYYGRFRFWNVARFRHRGREIRKFYSEYSRVRELHSDMAPSVIAHSFGTHIISQALLKFPSIEFDRVILCGSIVSRDYDWNTLVRSGRVGRIRNEVARNDSVVRLFRRRLMRVLVPGTGPSGIDKFTARCEQLEQPVFEFEHSSHFVTNDHCRTFWIPFIRGTEALKELCQRCRGPGEDSRAANEKFNLEYSSRIEAGVRRLFHYRSPSAEQIRDYCQIVRHRVIEKGVLGRLNGEQLIRREALALEEVTRREE